MTTEATEITVDQLAVMAERMARLEALVISQQAEIARLHAATAPLPAMPVTAASIEEVPTEEKPQGRASRRALLKLGGAAAAAGVAAAVAGTGTAQAHSATVTFQQSASGSGNFAIEGDGTLGAVGVMGTGDSSIGVLGTSTKYVGVKGYTAVASGYGVWGSNDAGIGAFGSSVGNVGVLGYSANYVGVQGQGATANGVGGWFTGGRAALALGAGSVPGAPTSGAHYAGDVYLDSTLTMWICTANGVPGTWVRQTGVQSGIPGGALNYLAAPIRIFDSRWGQPAPLPVSKAPLGGGTTTTIQVTGTTVGGLSVPTGATGVFGNLTVTNTQGGGDLILWPHGAPQPLTSNINYSGGMTIANAANVGLSSDGAMDLYVHVSGTDVIFDVAGYVL